MGEAGIVLIVDVAIGQRVQPRRQRPNAQPVTGLDNNRGTGIGAKEIAAGIETALQLRGSVLGGVPGTLEGQEIAGQQTTTARPLGDVGDGAVGDSDEQTMLVDTQPGASRYGIGAGYGAGLPACRLGQQYARGQAAAGVEFLAVGANNERRVLDDPVEHGKQTHTRASGEGLLRECIHSTLSATVVADSCPSHPYESAMSQAAKLRWGILGVAHINRRLIPAFGRAARAELRAIASRDLQRARAAARAAGVAVAHEGYEALLKDPDIDAVYIPLPNTLHGEWTRRAAEHGKHVLCEKPLAPTAPEAREVIDYCRARGVKLMDGFMWPHHPRTARIRQLIDSGAIGQVRHVTAAFTFPMESLNPSNIRLQRDLAGGSLLDVGCYPIYAIRWAFGAEPVRVFATARYLHEVDVEMSGMVWLADDRVGQFDCGFTLPYRSWVEIVGASGTIRVSDMWLPAPRATFRLERTGSEAQEMVIEEADQIVQMIDDFSRAVLEGEPVRPDIEEAVWTLRVLDALARSARERREIEV